MKWKWTAAWTPAFMLCLAVANACAQARSPEASDRRLLDSLATIHACHPRAFTVRIPIPVAGLSGNDRCTLVATAFDYIKEGGAQRAGMSPRDTVEIQGAEIFAFKFTDLSGGPSESYWTVEFQLPRRSYAMVVRIDRQTGKVRAGRGEKRPLTS